MAKCRGAKRFHGFNDSIFIQMTLKAREKGAINLAQGFPDFAGPNLLIERISHHLKHCPNQYTRPYGEVSLCEQIAKYVKNKIDVSYDANAEICVVNGATEGIMASILGHCDPGGGIVVFEPYYESYAQCAAMASGHLIGVPLLAPQGKEDLKNGVWHFDKVHFDKAMADNSKIIVLNHPHNPTGKVFTKDELEFIFGAAEKHDAVVIIDGVYEDLIYAPSKQYLGDLINRYRDRVIYISSISKTFSFTGFKVGWVMADRSLMNSIRRAHEGTVFCTPPHLQLGVADVLADHQFLASYLPSFKDSFQQKRDRLAEILARFGFRVGISQGSYFLLAQKHQSPLTAGDDHALANELLDNYGVASIPISSFYVKDAPHKDFLRFAFCKSDACFDEVERRLKIKTTV